MSINNFEDFIRGEEYIKVMYEEYDFIEIYKNNNKRILKRNNYKLYKLKNIDFPFALLKLIEDILDKINLEIIINETYTHNNLNYYCNITSNFEHYKFIENIYYNLDLKCDDNNNITIETSIDKKFNENNINEIDKFILNLLLFFVENTYTSYVKNDIFKKKLNKINLHSFVLNIT